jgi:hypothetical protein
VKKTKAIKLVLITATLAACNQTEKKDWETNGNSKVHLRSDTSAPYTRVHHHNSAGIGTALLWYYAFRPMGNYNNNQYQRAGYYSGGIAPSSNIGRNNFKGAVTRGGFGRSAYSVSS